MLRGMNCKFLRASDDLTMAPWNDGSELAVVPASVGITPIKQNKSGLRKDLKIK